MTDAKIIPDDIHATADEIALRKAKDAAIPAPDRSIDLAMFDFRCRQFLVFQGITTEHQLARADLYGGPALTIYELGNLGSATRFKLWRAQADILKRLARMDE